jgi:hypothetical protein
MRSPSKVYYARAIATVTSRQNEIAMFLGLMQPGRRNEPLSPTLKVHVSLPSETIGHPHAFSSLEAILKSQIIRSLGISAALASAVYGQTYQRQATIVGGGGPDRGKCTIEVVVDNVAQVEIRGATATLRNISGQPAQWRRFECTAGLPANPVNFGFSGVDGRGRQELVKDPRNGGVAVIQIEDKDGGSEGYTFDITWGNRGPENGGNGQYNNNPQPGGNNNNRNSPPPGPGNGNQPVYRENDRNAPPPISGNGNPPVYRDTNRDRADGAYRLNYRDSDYYRRYGHGFAIEEAVRVCQQEVLKQAAQRFRSTDIHFDRTTIDDNPGREDWVMGSLDIHRGPREERYGFSCSVNFDNGRVRSAQLDFRPSQGDRRE